MMLPEQKYNAMDNLQSISSAKPGVLSGIWDGFCSLSWIDIPLSTAGHLGLFLWSLGMVLFVPISRLPWSTALCLVAAVLVCPRSLRKIFCARRLIFLALMALPPIFLLGETDQMIFGIAFSQLGLLTALRISMRFVIIMISVDAFTSAVDISVIAGMMERFGLHGLGFSLGVALNLLPSFRTSATNAWQTLLMRGGLRKQRWRALQLLLTTIVSNGLQHAESIYLAAEARAFSIEKARPVPISVNALDHWIIAGAAGIFLCFLFY